MKKVLFISCAFMTTLATWCISANQSIDLETLRKKGITYEVRHRYGKKLLVEHNDAKLDMGKIANNALCTIASAGITTVFLLPLNNTIQFDQVIGAGVSGINTATYLYSTFTDTRSPSEHIITNEAEKAAILAALKS